MRRINENDISRIIKKVLREESNEKSDGIDACFLAARIPIPEQCLPQGYVSASGTRGDDMLAVISPGCIARLTAMTVTNPMNITKIGTLLTCLGALTARKIFKT